MTEPAGRRDSVGTHASVRRPPGGTHVDITHEYGYSPVVMPQHSGRIALLQGTLDVMVLQTLQALGAQHGYGIARRIEQISGDTVLLNQGTIYAALVRLQQRRWITAKWGTSENGRRAKYYTLTTRGRKQLEAETANWHKLASMMGRVLAQQGGEG